MAGKQKGKGDDRYLWPEMLRVIAELGPRWVVGENVPGILRIAAADVVADLERLGYHVVVFAFEAAAVGAYHRRERVAFVAHNDGEWELSIPQERYKEGDGACNDGEDVANANSRTVWNDSPDKRQAVGKEHSSDHAGHAGGTQDVGNTEMRGLTGEQHGRACSWRPCSASGWPAEPDVVRVAHGIPNRVDRLRCLGNAVVPAQFYPIFKAIMEEERA